MKILSLLLAGAFSCDVKKCAEVGGSSLSLSELNEDWSKRTDFCPAGYGLVRLPEPLDCCLTCGRQNGEKCSVLEPCDNSVGLHCTSSGTCQPLQTRQCYVDNYSVPLQTGQSFWQSCDTECFCLEDGSLGCRKSKDKRSPDPECIQEGIIDVGMQKKPENTVREWRPADEKKGIKSCTIQTTKWSTCSRTCGWGFSDRLSNNNDDCIMEKQIMLCKLRNCEEEGSSLQRGTRNLQSRRKFAYGGPRSRSRRQLPICKIKKNKVRTRRDTKKTLSFSGCRTKKPYQMRFCPQCPGTHCCPDMEPVADNNEKYKGFKVKKIHFVCDDGVKFKKKLMVIKRCVCGPQCKPRMSLFSGRRFDSY
ncbi:unnamed protein product [Oikopleura dioica]|uniref:CTCK domain-containing protein n=1 Tax=Oikopleura dioica TaxID=34765 RepID=E4WQV2_OIKDI|nr:unnamed protein product [Oikopleura dioica]